MIEIREVTVRYGSTVAVDDVTLTVPDGALYGLLGPNGAGKTSTISCIAGLVEPAAGQIVVGGIDVRQQPEEARRRLGLVPQTLALYPTLSVVQNLRFFGALFGLLGARSKDRVDWGLALAQLEGRAEARVDQLSGGMKRRLNLACALLHDPAVILCDEPTTGVDPQSRNHLFETIRQLNAEGRTVLYTTHYMEEVEALCTDVAIMDHGKVIADDRLDRLLATGAATRELTVKLDADVEPALLRQALADAGLPVAGVESRGRSLEKLFLELTGHGLRDT